MDCIDLRTLPPYRAWNELENRRAWEHDDPWDLIIRGPQHFVAPHGGEMLMACITSMYKITARRILELGPENHIHQDGDDGQNVIFHAKYFESVAKILNLFKKRQLTPEQGQIGAERLRAFREKTLTRAAGSSANASEQAPVEPQA